MINKIEYIDNKGDIISRLELANLKEYEKHIYEDDSLVKIERYKNGILDGGFIYLKEGQILEEIIAQFIKPDQTWGFIFNKVISGEYIIEETVVYVNGTLNLRYKTVENDKMIAMQTLDLATNEITSTIKYYYSDTFGNKRIDNELISVSYYDNGIRINTFLDEDEVYDVDDYVKRDDLMAVFNWHEHPYYHNSLPLIPEGNL